MAAEGTSRESLVYMGRIAEQSERYEEMVTLYVQTQHPDPPARSLPGGLNRTSARDDAPGEPNSPTRSTKADGHV